MLSVVISLKWQNMHSVSLTTQFEMLYKINKLDSEYINLSAFINVCQIYICSNAVSIMGNILLKQMPEVNQIQFIN